MYIIEHNKKLKRFTILDDHNLEVLRCNKKEKVKEFLGIRGLKPSQCEWRIYK